MQKAGLLLACSILFLGCGKDGTNGKDAIIPLPAALDPIQEEINYYVQQENENREGLAQSLLTPGLSCALSSITGGHRIQPTGTSGVPTLTGITAVTTYLYKGSGQESFNQPDSNMSEGMNVLPSALRPLFQNMYLLKCSGYVVVLEPGHYNFETRSDDASLLYLDNTLLVDNDNSHGITTKSKSKYLTQGLHLFRVEYAQSGGGNQALIVKVDGQSIDPKFYVH